MPGRDQGALTPITDMIAKWKLRLPPREGWGEGSCSLELTRNLPCPAPLPMA